MSERVLVGDIGGTNSRWAIFDGSLGRVYKTKTRDARSLREAAEQFLQGRQVAACCVAVAGPVENGKATLTNADWLADPAAMSIPTRVMNDLEGAAYGVGLLKKEDVVWPGASPDRAGVTLVLGVGTGFGGAVIQGESVTPLEPGHEPFLPADGGNLKGLIQPGTTVEHLLSGPGIVRMWRHFGPAFPKRPDISDADVSDWVVEHATIDPLAIAIRDAFCSAFVDASVVLAKRWNAARILYMGGVVEGWTGLLTSTKAWDKIERIAGCQVGVIQHPFPGLLGAGRLGQSLVGS